MIWLLVGTLYCAAAFIVGCMIYGFVKRKNNPIERWIRPVLAFAAAAVASNAFAMTAGTERAAYFTYGIYCILMDLMIVSLLFYAKKYTGITDKLEKYKNVTFFAVGADCVLMLINPFIKLIFRVGVYTDNFGNNFWRIESRGILYIYHIAVLYLIMIMVMVLLIKKITGSPKLYKIKYGAVLTAMCIVMAIHTIYLNFGLQFDYSLILYAALAFTVLYFSMIYVPRGLMERLLFFTISNMKDGIVCIDIDGKIVHANRTARDYSEADFDIRTLEKQIEKWFEEDISTNCNERTWETMRRIDGTNHYYNIEFRRIFDGNVKYLGCFFLIHDRTEEYGKYYAEKYRATHDMLTGIYNKEHFCELTRKMLDDNPDVRYCIVSTDVKNFKIVNDVFGVEAGDRLIKRIAEITASFGGDDAVYGRLTGDRFALCIPKYRFSEEELLSKFSEVDHFMENAAFKTHIHIGVYEVNDRRIRVSVMCDRANLAIRTIKDSYQNIVAYYDNELRESFMSEQKVISEFEVAIGSGQFQPYIQPQISADGRIRGGEALVRWLHPREGMIPPYKFIPIFEQTGLISRLDKLMWELACHQLRAWIDEGVPDCYISVNISQKDFYLLDVYETITSLVKKYSVPPASLHLEITETAIMNDPHAQLKLIERLRTFGFIVEIDDFGSGYSSLNMLKELDADVLKIDMGFLEKTEHLAKSQTILKMVIALAKSLNMEVITEGVETKEQVRFLAEYGCDLYQGYYFAKPMKVSDFEEKYLNAQIII